MKEYDKAEIEKWVRYDSLTNDEVKGAIEQCFKDEYRQGWYIDQIALSPVGEWILKWKRDITDYAVGESTNQ